MRVRGLALGLVAVALLNLPAAQAQWAIYGQATGANLQVPNTSHVYGGTFGFYDTKPFGLLAAGLDFRGALLKRGSSVGPYSDQALDMGLGGLRLAITPHAFPVVPYVEAMFGLGYWRGGIGTTRQDKTSAMAQFLGGLDYRIVPRVDWRVVEFSYGRLEGNLNVVNPETLSTGVVLRLP